MSAINRLHRTLINIIGITTEAGKDFLEVVVPSWNPYRVVLVPISLIPEEIMIMINNSLDRKEEVYLFAYVNTGVEKANDLYFTRFEIAPKLDENDGFNNGYTQ